MMSDGSERRRIPSVHWAGGYSNLITSGCLENGITFPLHTRLSLWASVCPRCGRPLCCLSFWGWVYHCAFVRSRPARGCWAAVSTWMLRLQDEAFCPRHALPFQSVKLYFDLITRPQRGTQVHLQWRRCCWVCYTSGIYSWDADGKGKNGPHCSQWDLLMRWLEPEKWHLSSGYMQLSLKYLPYWNRLRTI